MSRFDNHEDESETPSKGRHLLPALVGCVVVAGLVGGGFYLASKSQSWLAENSPVRHGASIGYHEPSYMHSAAERAQLDGLVWCAYHGHHYRCLH